MGVTVMVWVSRSCHSQKCEEKINSVLDALELFPPFDSFLVKETGGFSVLLWIIFSCVFSFLVWCVVVCGTAVVYI